MCIIVPILATICPHVGVSFQQYAGGVQFGGNLTLKSMNREFKGLLTYRTCPKTHDFRGVPGVTRDHHVLCVVVVFWRSSDR